MGADVDVKDNSGGTAPHGASSNSHEAVVRLLVEKGADVEAKAWDKMTPLHLAAAGREGG
jgi:ankyrin repeat protein